MKSIFSVEQQCLQAQLRLHREKLGLTQVELAERLSKPQSFISKVESGERILDLIELLHFCAVLDISATRFIEQLQKSINEARREV